MPRGAAPRVVVAGGGWGGLTAAKYLRRLAPAADVVLLERNPVFFSCPLSNKWLIDVVDDSFLTHDYLRTADRHGYRYVQCEVTEVDVDRRRDDDDAVAPLLDDSWTGTEGEWLTSTSGLRYRFNSYVRT